MNHGAKGVALATALLGAAAATTGCDWRVFDDLADDAWVRSETAPGDVSSSFWGVGVAAGGTREAGTSFVVLGRAEDSVSRFTYDTAGVLESSGTPVASLLSMANGLGPEPVFIGDPTTGDVLVAALEGGDPASSARVGGWTAATLTPTVNLPLSGGTAISAMAVGTTEADNFGGSGAGTVDLALGRGAQLEVVSNFRSGSPASVSCRHGRETVFALAVGDLDGDAANEQEVVVAVGNNSRDGSASEILIVSGMTIAEANAVSTGADCFDGGARISRIVVAAPGSEPDFGARVVVADFNADGALDIAASAPSANKVYVFTALDFGGSEEGAATTISGPAGSVSFGETMAAGNIDGAAGDELVVGDSKISIDGNTSSGAVYLYAGGTGGLGSAITLRDAQPEGNQRFGQSVAVVPYGATDNIVVVGADNEIFTYFRTPLTGDADVRVR